MTGYKKKLLPSKSTPKLQIGVRNIKNDYNFLNLDKFERTLETKSNFNNERIYQNDEGQIEENDNYERVDDFDEEDDDKINQQRQSQRFKIETYEPIEVGNKNENDEIIKDYKKNENLFLEPRDSTKLNQKKGSIPKSNYNKKNTKKIYDKMNKRDKGPRDSGNSGIKINFRGTFENKNMNNINIGPRDSKRKNDNELNYNMDNIEIPYIIDNNDVIGKNKIKNNNDDDGELIFVGEYLNGKRNGKGEEYDIINDDLSFIGEYKNDKRWNGKGIEFNKYGEIIFEGEYFNGKKLEK